MFTAVMIGVCIRAQKFPLYVNESMKGLRMFVSGEDSWMLGHEKYFLFIKYNMMMFEWNY